MVFLQPTTEVQRTSRSPPRRAAGAASGAAPRPAAAAAPTAKWGLFHHGKRRNEMGHMKRYGKDVGKDMVNMRKIGEKIWEYGTDMGKDRNLPVFLTDPVKITVEFTL